MRQQIRKLWIFLVIAFSLVGCAPSEKKFVTSDLYTIDVAEKPFDEKKYLFILNPSNHDVVYRTSKFPMLPITATYIKSSVARSHVFKYDSLEIVFMRPYNPDSSGTPEFCHISCRNFNDRPKAFIIFWKNHFNKISREYMQDIGEMTDTLLSTLDFETIKKLYPIFKGIYKQVQLDSIILDPNFHELNPQKEKDLYYDHIQFKGFKLQ
jgi:hypothetical protein